MSQTDRQTDRQTYSKMTAEKSQKVHASTWTKQDTQCYTDR